MAESTKHHRRNLIALLILVMTLAVGILIGAAVTRKPQEVKEEVRSCFGNDDTFSLLIMGDSQMAGYGWEGGYGNCISETYPNAVVVNLAQSGSHLTNGEILAQWEFYLEQTDVMPDFILIDGGINDLPYLRREEFQENGMGLISEALGTILERIHEDSPDTRIIYTLMPPFAEWKDSLDGPPSYEIQERYWKRLGILASSYDYVTVLDLFSLNPLHYPCVECYSESLADSIHLSEAGYRKTFEYINNAIMPHLAQQPDGHH